MAYDAVLLDFDGVVVEPPTSSAMGTALERTYEAFDRSAPSREAIAGFVRGNLDDVAEQCRELGVDTDRFCARAAREAIRTQREEVQRGVRSLYDDVAALATVDRPLGLVSDNHPTVLFVLLRQFGLTSLFETVHGCPFTRTGFSRHKPDPYNVETAMATLDAETALFVGDRDVDVRAAHNAGIDSALIEREETTADVTPTYRLESLREVPELLDPETE